MLLIGACVYSSCNSKDDFTTVGYKPIYAQFEEIEIKNVATIPNMENSGKIYLKDNYFYQIDNGKGLFVYDITNKSQPTVIAFIKILGAQEISIKNNNLYVNSLNDLVLIDITNILAVKEKSRLKETFHIVDQQLPPEAGYFECVDEKQGAVIGWKQETLKNPNCRR